VGGKAPAIELTNLNMRQLHLKNTAINLFILFSSKVTTECLAELDSMSFRKEIQASVSI